jgi:hypothetical protein
MLLSDYNVSITCRRIALSLILGKSAAFLCIHQQNDQETFTSFFDIFRFLECMWMEGKIRGPGPDTKLCLVACKKSRDPSFHLIGIGRKKIICLLIG